jgi:hypothetical protein
LRQRLALRLLGAVVGYVAILAIYLVALWVAADEVWRMILGVAHLLAALLVIGSFVLFYMQLDELQRRMQGEAFSIALAGTALVALVYGFLQGFGLPQVSWVFVFPVMLGFWFAGLMAAERRYE